MAALSCYQPCRSHLAQPARCYDDEVDHSATLSLRRRQFIERCHETRPRYKDAIPEVSVRKTRDELTKYAGQNAPTNRRLNVENGWSKVEEVRKKFEGAAAAASYSRSFESPPRRRLADSLFASFKLPRKKDGTMLPRSLAPPPQQKRKSAVQLLAESKAFYVKTETVRDRKQELPLRMNSGLGQAIAAGGCHLVSSGTLNNDPCCNPYATTRSSLSRRAISAGDGLQNTLRRLLEHSDSRENMYSPVYAVPHKVITERRHKDSYHEREINRSQLTSGTFSGTSSSGTSGSRAQKDHEIREKMNRPLSFGDARIFFPESFVIPRQRPNEIMMKSAYSIPSSHSSPSHSELPDPLPSDIISPPPLPFERRSNSHSQPSMRDEDGVTNINSHKSLPDLHTQARSYIEHVHSSGMETVGRSPRRRRHSSHQRTASCSSKGTRSNHSSLMSSCEAFSEHPSPGDNYQSYNSRCGSSFARDSGGSSGHYTQRSAPPHTQRDNSHDNRRLGYYSPSTTEGVVYVSAPPQFQDGAPSPPRTPPSLADPPVEPPRVGIHFQASAPPPQFQDDPPAYDYQDYDCYNKTPVKCVNVTVRKDYGKIRDRERERDRERDYIRDRYHDTPEHTTKLPQHAEVRLRPRIDDTQEYVNTTQLCPTGEVTSPLGTFKRQRCLRYKQRRPRPILRSKSDISDRYRRTDGRSPASAPCEDDLSDSPSQDSSDQLHQFFCYLGLGRGQYDAVVRESPPDDSPVFFSEASTVDSNQIVANTDYTVQGPGAQKPIYRNTEPPSVVERNARIIKWLCQCRKAQMPPATQ